MAVVRDSGLSPAAVKVILLIVLPSDLNIILSLTKRHYIRRMLIQ
jgi:hypothetical protein